MELLTYHIFSPVLGANKLSTIIINRTRAIKKNAQIWPYRMAYATVCEHNLDRQPSFACMQNSICNVNDSIGDLVTMLVCIHTQSVCSYRGFPLGSKACANVLVR